MTSIPSYGAGFDWSSIAKSFPRGGNYQAPQANYNISVPTPPMPPRYPMPVTVPTANPTPVNVPVPMPYAVPKPIDFNLYVPKATPLPYYPQPAPAPSYPPPAPPVYHAPPPPAPAPAPTPVPPPPPAYPPVAANQHAAAWGDPHILDADSGLTGTNKRIDYDFNLQGKFNLLNDTGVSLTADFSKGPNTTTITTNADLTLGADKINVKPGGKTTVNGQNVVDKVTVNGTVVDRNGESVDINTASQFEYNFKFETEHFMGHQILNTHVYSKNQGVDNGRMPTGLLGETFDIDSIINKAPKLALESYRVA